MAYHHRYSFTPMIYDTHINNALRDAFTMADQRVHFGDDEHRPPMPLYGAARAYDRMPVAWPTSPSERTVNVRAQYNVAVSTINTEEGA